MPVSLKIWQLSVEAGNPHYLLSGLGCLFFNITINYSTDLTFIYPDDKAHFLVIFKAQDCGKAV